MQIAANQSRLTLKILDFSDDTFSVHRLQSQQYTLSGAYEFLLECTALSEFDPSSLCGEKAKIRIDGEQSVYIHGFVARCSLLGKNYDQQNYAYKIVLASPLEALKKCQQPRIFLQKNIIEIVEEILHSVDGLEINTIFSLHQDYPRHDFILQLNESDFSFFSRMLAEAGLVYRFIQNPNTWQLEIFDDSRLLQPNTTISAKSLYYFREELRLLPEKVQITNYAYQKPEHNLTAEGLNATAIPGAGTQENYGDNVTTIEAIQSRAKLKAEIIDCQRQSFFIETDCNALRPGQIFTLTDHANAEYNGNYLIIAADITANQHSGLQMSSSEEKSPATYKAILRVIKANVVYRPPLISRAPFYHIIPAIVESPGDYPLLDEFGRYFVHFPFDQSDRPKGEASCPIRLLQTHGGINKNGAYGMHFALRNGTQVAVGFMQGDLDRPVILGVIHNPENPTPVTTNNAAQNILRTFAGNELTLDDHQQNPFVQLATKNHQNRLRLDASENNHKIDWISEQGKLHAYAKKTLHIDTGDSYIQNTGANHFVSVANKQTLLTKTQDIQHQSGKDFLATAGENLQLASQNETQLTAAQSAQLSANNNFSAWIKNGTLQMQTEQNDLNIRANGNLIIHSAGNNLTILGQPTGGITMTPEGNLLLQGPKVSFEAPEINIYGMHVVNNSSTIPYTPPPQLSKSRQKKKKDNTNDEEFKLFVVTVYGEAAGCSETAWKAVGSVIINRLSCKEYRRYKTVTEIIEYTRFQAYDDKSPNFLSAKSYLDNISNKKPVRIDEIIAALKPVYYDNLTNTDADHYYSPKVQHRGHDHNKDKYKNDTPNWVTQGLRNGNYIEVKISGLNPITDDFRFFKTVK